MSRYHPLCIFVMISALFESTVAAPEPDPGEGSTSAENTSALVSAVKNLANKVGRGLSRLGSLSWMNASRWEHVTFLVSGTGDEEGVLLIADTDGYTWSYCFYPYSTGSDVELCFHRRDMTSTARDKAVVKFTLEETDNLEYTFIFANEMHALEFLGEEK